MPAKILTNMYLACINQQHPDLAQGELEALAREHTKRIDDVVLVSNDPTPFASRLAFTKSIMRVLFTCDPEELQEHMARYPWDVAGSFRMTTSKCTTPAGRLGAIVKEKTGAAVSLKNPKTHLQTYCRDRAYVGILIWERSERFEQRRGKYRAAHHPTTMHPQLARALVNLTGMREGALLDPMCGAGGILIEAALMNIHVSGSDIDPTLIEKAKRNLSQFKQNVPLTVADATTITSPLDYVVTDLPYGRSTKKHELARTYEEFFAMLGRNLKERAVVMYPHWADCKHLATTHGLEIEQEFSIYSHKSLTRKILVLRKNTTLKPSSDDARETPAYQQLRQERAR